MEKDISSGDPEVIKKRRSTIQRMMTTVGNRLGKMLAKVQASLTMTRLVDSKFKKRKRVSKSFREVLKLSTRLIYTIWK